MSSKLVKKSLELISGNSDKIKNQKNSKDGERNNFARGTLKGQKRLGKINKTKRNYRRKLKKQTLKKKGKTANDKAKDFTQENLEYLSNTNWKLDQNVYKTVIKHYEDRKLQETTQEKLVSFDQESNKEIINNKLEVEM